MNLSKNVKVVCVKAAQTADTAAIVSTGVDISGYDGVMFFGTIATANDGNFLQVEQSAGDFTAKSVLDGAKMVTKTNGDIALVDVYRPQEKLGKNLRASITRAGASTATGDIYAILYNGRLKPEKYGVLAVSPAAESV